MAVHTENTDANAMKRTIVSGIIGGLAGGVVFGVMMGLMGMLPMVGMLVGQDNPVIGFVVHMVISAIFGASYGVIAPMLPIRSMGTTIAAGLAYGVILWVVGALVLMPLMLGMSAMVLQVGPMQINSLIGHLFFGVILAVVNKRLLDRP